MPHQLSGGQRQRVALARALAVEPRVLLLDEPFGALDAQVRKDLRRWLRRLHDEVGITSVFVTHDQEEALEVADRVVVFNHGRIEQVGTPEQVYLHPATPFVHAFLGSVNVFPDPTRSPGKGSARYVRPHDIEISRQTDEVRSLPAVVRLVATAGPVVRVELEQSAEPLHVDAEISHDRHGELALKPGDQVFIGFRKYQLHGTG
jgi:sulfate transport system ATP-binding protein